MHQDRNITYPGDINLTMDTLNYAKMHIDGPISENYDIRCLERGMGDKFTYGQIMANSLWTLAWSVFVQCDAAEPWQIGFQDGASPTFEGITELHNAIFFYLVLIFIGVMWVLGSVVINYSSTANPISHKYSNHGTLIELVWTITPAFILIAIAFPSFKLLYLMDDVISPAMTIKAVGHQWYWSYEYSDFVNEDGESIEFDSYMIPDSDLEDGQLRLLDVDNRVVLPVDTHVRFVVTGADVIHDFAVPSLGLKIDCCPGRI